MSSLLDVTTPRVLIDRRRLRSNIVAMQALAKDAGVRLRPHSKTHKSPVIARWQIEAGAVGVCCAKLGEAEVMADAGIQDIRLPYPVHPTNAPRVLALLQKTRLSIIVDNLEVANGWSAAMAAAGATLDILVKVDVGFHRCGIDPDAASALETLKQISALPGLRFRGLLSHAGQAYLAQSAQEIRDIAQTEQSILITLAGGLRDAGVDVPEISVGSTPTARQIRSQRGITEMRPGNYVFFDRTQVGLGAASLDDCAMSVLAMVVSRPSPTRVVFDAGSKMLSTDGVRGFGASTGHGIVFSDLIAPVEDAAIAIERLSEEHAVARVPADHALRVGDRVRIVPNHACVVMNLANTVLLTDGPDVVEELAVAARGRCQ
ncbi:MAG TPA: alanine racemase [Vicinamibacterales bacterium]|nr:alanine racemase [Vicinamibacterales bacterium]